MARGVLRDTGRVLGDPPRRDCSGFTLLETLFVVGLVAVMAGIAVPALTAGLERLRAGAAARYLAGQMALARTRAVTRSATVALRFHREPGGLLVSVYVDGNGNGVRSRDIDSGIDRQVDSAVRLEDLFPGVTIAVPAAFSSDAVELGGTELLSFTPAGTATSGTIAILGRDGSQFAVRVLGVTGRIRLLRFDPQSRQWIDFL